MTDVVKIPKGRNESSDGENRLRHAITPAHDEAAVVGDFLGKSDFFHREQIAREREI